MTVQDARRMLSGRGLELEDRFESTAEDLVDAVIKDFVASGKVQEETKRRARRLALQIVDELLRDHEGARQ